jgi:RNA polymerase sigma-70 factor (ECF subfamily)
LLVPRELPVKTRVCRLAPALLKGWLGGNSAMSIVHPSTPSLRAVPSGAPDAPSMGAALVVLLPDLRRRAARLALTPAAADDLVQDTVERALRFSAQYDPGSNLRGWAYQILFSVFITGYRRRRRERRGMELLTLTPSAWTQRSPFASPETQLSLTPSTTVALDSLPVGFRDVVSLIDLGDHTYREAAEMLAVPLGTVMSRLHRGRRMLAERLGVQVTGAAA